MNYNHSALIEKYWAGESSLEEEQIIRDYLASDKVSSEHQDLVPLFSLFQQQGHVTLTKDIDRRLFINQDNDHQETKVRRLWPRMAAVAASLAILMVATFTYIQKNETTTVQYAEIENAEEALEITMEALAYLGHNYDKGTSSIKHLKQLEKTNVFSFN